MACKVLITGGGCEEPLDRVRYLTNFSTGSTAAVLAERFLDKGCSVCLLAGMRAVVPRLINLEVRRFRTFADLETELKALLAGESIDLVIQAAAVSDYSIDRMETGEKTLMPGETGKIDSRGELRVILKKNGKLIDRIRDWSRNKEVRLIGFKLTDSGDRPSGLAAVRTLLGHARPDWVVWNDLTGIDGDMHRAEIFDASGQSLGKTETKLELGDFLVNLYHNSKKMDKGDL